MNKIKQSQSPTLSNTGLKPKSLKATGLDGILTLPKSNRIINIFASKAMQFNDTKVDEVKAVKDKQRTIKTFMNSDELDEFMAIINQKDIVGMGLIKRGKQSSNEERTKAIFRYIIDPLNTYPTMSIVDLWDTKNYVNLKKKHKYVNWKKDVWKVRAQNNSKLYIKNIHIPPEIYRFFKEANKLSVPDRIQKFENIILGEEKKRKEFHYSQNSDKIIDEPFSGSELIEIQVEIEDENKSQETKKNSSNIQKNPSDKEKPLQQTNFQKLKNKNPKQFQNTKNSQTKKTENTSNSNTIFINKKNTDSQKIITEENSPASSLLSVTKNNKGDKSNNSPLLINIHPTNSNKFVSNTSNKSISFNEKSFRSAKTYDSSNKNNTTDENKEKPAIIMSFRKLDTDCNTNVMIKDNEINSACKSDFLKPLQNNGKMTSSRSLAKSTEIDKKKSPIEKGNPGKNTYKDDTKSVVKNLKVAEQYFNYSDEKVDNLGNQLKMVTIEKPLGTIQEKIYNVKKSSSNQHQNYESVVITDTSIAFQEIHENEFSEKSSKKFSSVRILDNLSEKSNFTQKNKAEAQDIYKKKIVVTPNNNKSPEEIPFKSLSGFSNPKSNLNENVKDKSSPQQISDTPKSFRCNSKYKTNSPQRKIIDEPIYINLLKKSGENPKENNTKFYKGPEGNFMKNIDNAQNNTKFKLKHKKNDLKKLNVTSTFTKDSIQPKKLTQTFNEKTFLSQDSKHNLKKVISNYFYYGTQDHEKIKTQRSYKYHNTSKQNNSDLERSKFTDLFMKNNDNKANHLKDTIKSTTKNFNRKFSKIRDNLPSLDKSLSLYNKKPKFATFSETDQNFQKNNKSFNYTTYPTNLDKSLNVKLSTERLLKVPNSQENSKKDFHKNQLNNQQNRTHLANTKKSFSGSFTDRIRYENSDIDNDKGMYGSIHTVRDSSMSHTKGFSDNKEWLPSMKIMTPKILSKNQHVVDEQKRFFGNFIEEIVDSQKGKEGFTGMEIKKIRFDDWSYLKKEMKHERAMEVIQKIQDHLTWVNSIQKSTRNPNFF